MREEELQLNSRFGSARYPGLRLLANGRHMRNVASATIRSTNYFGADQFEVTLGLNSDAPFWSVQTSIDVDISLRLDEASDYATIIQGYADSIRLDPIAQVVHIEGRDYAAGLIDSVSSETFSNRTASEIATILAQRHGLFPAVTPTVPLAGRYYQGQHDTILLDTFCGKVSEWDLLCFLAQRESFDLFVSKRTLNFQPRTTGLTQYYYFDPGDVIDLHLERNLTLAGEVEVTVKTWNSHQHSAELQTARRDAAAPAGFNQIAPRRFVVIRPNLTSDKAQQLAQRKLAELCAHDMSIEVIMPGELILTPRTVLALQGSNTPFDQTYRIDVIERKFSPKHGFVQRVRGSSLPSV